LAFIVTIPFDPSLTTTEPNRTDRLEGVNLVQVNTEALPSSRRLNDFLNATGLHKKDFAEMIGVTLSYVYSLLDTSMSFSTRITTLERIAVVMSVSPDSFTEYKATDDPQVIDPGVQFFQARQAELGLDNLQFLRRFPRSKRVMLVDLWRGVLPLPLSWSELMAIALVLELGKKDIYPYWEARFRQYLHDGGLDPVANAGLTMTLMDSAKQHLQVLVA
jgi:transcriptional regulator with XRE-family HTH domain